MARLKITARPIGSEDIEASEEERRQLSEGEEDLTNVDADPSELMGTGRSLLLLSFLVSRGRPGSWSKVMSRKGILAPEFAVPLVMRLHRTLAMESVLCFGTSSLPVCVFR